MQQVQVQFVLREFFAEIFLVSRGEDAATMIVAGWSIKQIPESPSRPSRTIPA